MYVNGVFSRFFPLKLKHRILIDFSNILSKTVIERLADADEYEVVREVQVH